MVYLISSNHAKTYRYANRFLVRKAMLCIRNTTGQGLSVRTLSNKAQSTKHIEMLSSIGHRRDKNGPNSLPRKEEEEFRRSPEVQKLNVRIKEATAKMPLNSDKGSAQLKVRQQLYTEKQLEPCISAFELFSLS